eukprot:scaffold218257_cov22-Cyclotella_meneghiniana.AAC.1
MSGTTWMQHQTLSSPSIHTPPPLPSLPRSNLQFVRPRWVSTYWMRREGDASVVFICLTNHASNRARLDGYG